MGMFLQLWVIMGMLGEEEAFAITACGVTTKVLSNWAILRNSACIQKTIGQALGSKPVYHHHASSSSISAC